MTIKERQDRLIEIEEELKRNDLTINEVNALKIARAVHEHALKENN